MSLPNIAKIFASGNGGTNAIFPATENNVTNININNAAVVSPHPGPSSSSSSFYCDHCQKKHDYAAQCPQRIFRNGDKWCDKCQRVHYNNRTCADDANAVVENNKTWFCKAGCNRIHVDDEDPCPESAC
jgi:hypothetical protein